MYQYEESVMLKIFLIFVLQFGVIGCGGEEPSRFSGDIVLNSTSLLEKNTLEITTTKAFFGDKQNNDVLVVDVDNMRLANPGRIPTGHEITYTADKVYNQPKVYVVNRGSDAIDVMDINTHEIVKTIPLLHHPRSAEAMNKKLGLCAVSGMDKPMVSIIDTKRDEVVAVVGKDEVTFPVVGVHGGKHACGHPFWLDAHHFVLLDRAHKTITTYVIKKSSDNGWNTRKLNEISTPSSVHQIIPSKGYYNGDKHIFYATAEGSDEEYPAILKFLLTDSGLYHIDDVQLIRAGIGKNEMGLHHADFHPNKKFIYVGSAEGSLFVVDYSDMDLKIKTILDAGKGAGHTVMIPERNLALVINHKDRFITAIDTRTDEKIKDIQVSYLDDSAVGKVTIQAHPKYFVSKDKYYFYAFLTEEGILYKLDLSTLEVLDTLWVGGKPAQGSFVPFVNKTTKPNI